MARIVGIKSYSVRVAVGSQGFNEWRTNITVDTEDTTTHCDVRFVDDPSMWKSAEKVNETGWSQTYLPTAQFDGVLHLLQTEKPLYIVLYGAPVNRVIVQTNAEPPGEEESSP